MAHVRSICRLIARAQALYTSTKFNKFLFLSNSVSGTTCLVLFFLLLLVILFVAFSFSFLPSFHICPLLFLLFFLFCSCCCSYWLLLSRMLRRVHQNQPQTHEKFKSSISCGCELYAMFVVSVTVNELVGTLLHSLNSCETNPTICVI